MTCTKHIRRSERLTAVFCRAALTAVTLLLALLPLPHSAFAAQVNVAATVPALAAIAREIGGDRVSITSLSLPTQDPHFVDARPSLALALNRADLLLLVGLELEQGWLPTLLTGSRNPKIQLGAPGYLDCSASVRLLGIPQGPVDRRMGDVHAGGNPHYLFAPKNALSLAQTIADRFSQIDPEGAAAYAENARKFRAALSSRIEAWEKRMAPFRGRAIISYHSSWLYLADWLGLKEVAFVEPKPGIAPTPAHVTKVLAAGRREKVGAILQETFYADSTSRLIAEKIPAKLVKLQGGPDFRGGESYADSIEALIAAVESALSGGSAGAEQGVTK